MRVQGDVGTRRLQHYSRGIRQSLYRLAKQHSWKDKYSIWIGESGDVPGDYSEGLARSTFALVAPGG